MGFAWWSSRFLAFSLFYIFEVTIVEASPHLFVDKPSGCSVSKILGDHCAISSGDNPYAFADERAGRWEISKHTVLVGAGKHRWKIALGQFVLKAQRKIIIETPFGEIHTGKTDVFVELLEDRVHVSVLNGEAIEFRPRSGDEAMLLTPGFQNWYGGLGPQGQVYGVPEVMELEVYAQKRVHFFVDHKLGFVNELKSLAVVVKKASLLAAKIHQKLVAGKMGLLEEKFQEGVRQKNRQVEYDGYLRKLFRKKMRYDD